MEPEPIKPEPTPEPTPEPVKPEPTPEPVKPEPTPEPVKPAPAAKKRIEVDEEEFEGMKTRLSEMEARSKKKPPPTAPPTPSPRKRAIDRIHGSFFGR